MEVHSAVFFWEKKNSNEISLVDDNDTIVSDDQSISEELNTFFKNNTKSLNYTAKLLPNRWIKWNRRPNKESYFQI